MTGAIRSHSDGRRNRGSDATRRLEIDIPTVADGPALHRITSASGVLDVNSCYAYLLWCRDFSHTSAVARFDGAVVGFVTGFLRPQAPETLLVWQVAVDASHRGAGVAGKLLNHLVDRLTPGGVRYLETTISADNAASIKLFSRLAQSRRTEITSRELFPADLFPDAHLGEDLYRIGPFTPGIPGTEATIGVPGGSGAVETENTENSQNTRNTESTGNTENSAKCAPRHPPPRAAASSGSSPADGKSDLNA